jgi:N-acetylmuramoyl-L-alanine amidase
LLAASAFLIFAASDEKRLTIYSNAANYSLPLTDHNGTDYIGLLETLEPLGNVTAKTNGSHWKLRYNDADCEFTVGKTKAHIRGADFNLPAAFLLDNNRGLVPLSSLNSLLPRILGGPVTFHEPARRLFIGNVGVNFTAQITRAIPPTLVMNFTSPVNPMIATEPGKLRMVFSHEAVMPPASQTLTFDSKTIPAATFQEANGAAELIVTGTVPLMASFSPDGRTITIAPPPSSAPPSQSAMPSAVPGGEQSTQTSSASARRYFAVIDASHGGDERGAALSEILSEKDVTLAFARHLRQELEARGVKTLLLRDGDTTLSVDQRAGTTNIVHPAIYICIHAASQGKGVYLYTSAPSTSGDNRGLFVDWNSAQIPYHSISQTAAASFLAELQSKRLPARSLSAALRPLNNVETAAVAVEVAPSGSDLSQLTLPSYQQSIADAIAAGVIDIRDRLEAAR